MQTTQKLLLGILAAGMYSLTPSTQATITYDQNVTPTVLFGSGNGNGSFTVAKQDGGGVELGLRAKVRGEGVYNSNGNGTYTFLNSTLNGGQTWNFEWTVNTDWNNDHKTYTKLDDLTYKLRVDTDPTLGKNFVEFDPINGANPQTSTVLWDHGIGDNSTANGAGDNDSGRDATSYAKLIADNNVAQNSWRELWNSINPNVNGTYDFELQAYAPNGDSVTMTMMTVNVVPEPSTYLAGALFLLPFGIHTIRRMRKS